MAKKTRKGKAATPRKFWRVQGSQTEYVSRDRFVEAATPEEARDAARQGDLVIREEDGDRDWGKWQSEDYTDLSDIEEVTEAEAKGLPEEDAPSVVDPLWETIAPTLEEDADAEGYLLGDVEILGVKFHVEAVRVDQEEDGSLTASNPDNAEKLEAMLSVDLDGNSPQTVKIPGTGAGRWVLTISAYAQ